MISKGSETAIVAGVWVVFFGTGVWAYFHFFEYPAGLLSILLYFFAFSLLLGVWAGLMRLYRCYWQPKILAVISTSTSIAPIAIFSAGVMAFSAAGYCTFRNHTPATLALQQINAREAARDETLRANDQLVQQQMRDAIKASCAGLTLNYTPAWCR
jgi:hypothetical protein